MLYKDNHLVINLGLSTVHDLWAVRNKYWDIFKTKVNNEDVYYLYNKKYLHVVCYFIFDKPFAGIGNFKAIDTYKPFIIDDMRYNKYQGTYTFSLFVNGTTKQNPLHIEYDTHTDILTIKHKPTQAFGYNVAKVFKNNVPKLDDQNKVKLTLGGVCVFTELDSEVLRKTDV